jgi:hypothetical protein
VTALLFLIALAGQVEADATDDRAAEVRRLVRQLDAAELSTRNQAEEKLVGLGAEILELLPKEPGGSAELQQRLTRIRETLEKKVAADSAKASTITLTGSKPLSEVIADIEKQTGNKLIDIRDRFGQQAPDSQVKTDFEKMPFWQAVDTVLDRAGMSVYNYANEAGLAIIEKPEKQLDRGPRASYVGPLRIEVTRVSAERMPALEESGSLKVALEIAWEPRLRPITFQQSLASLKAVDDAGNQIKVGQEEGELEASVQSGTAVEMELPFALPPRTAKSIKSLKGSLTALLPGKIETFEFDDLAAAAKPEAKPVEKKHAAATVVLDTVRQNGEIWEVRVRVRFDAAANALESHRTWIFQNEAYMVGPDGKRIDNSGFETTLRDENEVGVAYLFEPPAGLEGCKFIYKSPSSLHVIPVEYELKDLQLP